MKPQSTRNRTTTLAAACAVLSALLLLTALRSPRPEDPAQEALAEGQAIVADVARVSAKALRNGDKGQLAAINRVAIHDTSVTRLRFYDHAGSLLVQLSAVEPNAHPRAAARTAMPHPAYLATLRAPVLARVTEPAERRELAPEVGWVEIDLVLPALRAKTQPPSLQYAVIAALLLLTVLASAIACRGGVLPAAWRSIVNKKPERAHAKLHAAKTVAHLRRGLRWRDADADALARGHRAALRASRSQAYLLAKVSHETRNLMHALLGLTRVLPQDSEGYVNHENLPSLNRSLRGLLSLLDNALGMARAEAGVAETGLVQIDALLRDMHTLFAPGAYARGLEFHTAPFAVRHLQARTAVPQLRQVLINLIGNAVKFTRRGHVAISADLGPAIGHRRWVRFVVQDTGPGIPVDARRQLFTPFSGSRVGQHHDMPGTGLGLHIVKRIIDRLQGRISVHTVPGKGSRITVSLPLALEQPSGAGAARAPVLPAVLIEDYPNLSRQRRRFITQADLRLVQRPEGTAGVVLVDIAARRLHSEQSAVERPLPRGPWPLIAYASTYDPRTLRWLRRRGYAGVLVKAGCPRTLRKGLDDILNRCAPSLPCRTAARRPVRKCTVRGRALVVDDDPLNLQVMRHFCAVLELGVDCASSVTEAIELMHTARYTLIFTDVHMPAVGGHAIARAVRNAPSPRAAIVALTADSCLQHARLCELGFDGLLRKPVSLRQLRSCVQRHHANRVPRAGSDCREARVAELRTALRERLPSERAALQALVRTSRYSHLAFAAHRLHGATLYCDVPELTDAVRRLERGARAANAALTAVALADALMAIDRFLASCKPYPPSHQLGIWQ